MRLRFPYEGPFVDAFMEGLRQAGHSPWLEAGAVVIDVPIDMEHLIQIAIAKGWGIQDGGEQVLVGRSNN